MRGCGNRQPSLRPFFIHTPGRFRTFTNIRPVAFLWAILMLFPFVTFGQLFINLDFEQAYIVPDTSSPYYPYAVDASQAIPGWTPVGFLSPDILYNDISLGATSITLCGVNSMFSPPPLDGQFSIDLYGGTEGPASGASISQTGTVPVGAESIRFIAQGVAQPAGGPLLVSLGGHNIPYSAVSTGPNYTVYAGDISAFAGQTEQLTFTAPQGVNNYWELDDIQFSSTQVPEPSSWSLLALGSLLMGRWMKRRGEVEL